MYSVNQLSIYSTGTSASALKLINKIVFYLFDCLYLPIMYPYDLDITFSHELHMEVSPGNFHTKNISNGLFPFAIQNSFSWYLMLQTSSTNTAILPIPYSDPTASLVMLSTLQFLFFMFMRNSHCSLLNF